MSACIIFESNNRCPYKIATPLSLKTSVSFSIGSSLRIGTPIFPNSRDELRRYEIACLLGKVQPATILDIGCGCGFHDREMATYPFVRSVDAFDYSAKSIEKAEAVYGHSKVQRWVGDLVTDVPERRYDLVVSFQIFEHLSKPETYFRFCRAACAPGGAIAIFTPNRKRLSNRILGTPRPDARIARPAAFQGIYRGGNYRARPQRGIW